MLVGGTLLGLLFFALLILVNHEASHGMFLVARDGRRARRWNRIFGWATSLPFGMHFVKVLEQIRARPPRLEEVRDQVRAEMVREVSRRLANERFEALRRHYELRVVRTGARAER